VSELRDVAPPGLVEGGGFGERNREIVEMVLSFSVVYAAVAMVTRFRVLEAFLFGDRERDRENLDSSDNRAHNLLKCTDC
jgi:hypothetical protein